MKMKLSTRKIIAVLVLLVWMTASFSGCFGRPKAGKDFAVPILDEPMSLDPQIAKTNTERLVAANCYEGLLSIDENGKLIGGVAENYTVSDNRLVYDFTLRQDAQWGIYAKNGALLKKTYGDDYKKLFSKTVTAADFAFALDRTLNPQTGAPDAYLFAAIKTVRVLDTFHLQIELAYPDENFLYALLSPAAMPCNQEFFELTGGRYGLEPGYMLCNGPFHVANWLEKTSIKLSKTEVYKGEREVQPASVTLYYNADETLIPQKMEEEIYDAGFVTESQWQAFAHPKDFKAQTLTDTTEAFLFNQTDTNLANENLRLALSRALDWNSTSKKDNPKQAKGIIPPFCTIGPEPFRAEGACASGILAPDADAAKQNFDEALLELGATSVELEVLCTQEKEEFVRQVLQLWQKTLGVKFVVSVTVLPFNELAASIQDGNYQIALFPVRAIASSASDFLETFGENNHFGFEDATYRSFLSNMRKDKSDFSKLRADCEEAENYLLSHAVLLPVEHENNCFIMRKHTEGIYFYASRDNLYFINAVKA